MKPTEIVEIKFSKCFTQSKFKKKNSQVKIYWKMSVLQDIYNQALTKSKQPNRLSVVLKGTTGALQIL